MSTDINENEEITHLAAIDGDKGLEQQQESLNLGQNGFNAEVTSYSKAEGGKPPNQFQRTNNVTFTEVGIGEPVRPIQLKIVDSEDEAELDEDQDQAFDSEVFVQGVVKRVIGFHMKPRD
jgi:hypothetical protein